MASASDHRAHAALQPADCLILLPQRLPAAVETSIGPAHYPAECTQSDAFLQPSLRARYGRANSNSFNRACAPVTGAQTLIRFYDPGIIHNPTGIGTFTGAGLFHFRDGVARDCLLQPRGSCGTFGLPACGRR